MKRINWFNGIKLQMFRKQSTGLLKRFLPLLTFFMYYCTFSYSQANKYYTVNAKFKMEGSFDYKDAYMVLSRNGKAIETLPGQSSYKIDLEYGGDYVLSFSKPGYITKKININTVVDDEERISQGFESYPFTVILIKQYDDVNIVVFNQPVAKINYSKKFDDFDYDTDYTKSIQSAIKKAEDELKEKEKELKANPPKPAVDSTAIIAKQKKEEELKAKEEAKKLAEAEKKKEAEEKAAKKKEEEAQAAALRLKEKEAADEKKKLEAIAAADARKAAEEKAAEEKQRKLTEKAEADAKRKADEQAAADEKKALAEKAAEDKQRRIAEKEEADAKRQADERLAGEEKRKIAEEKAAEDAKKKKANEGIGEDGNKDLAMAVGNDGVKPNIKLSGGSDRKEDTVSKTKGQDAAPESKIEKPKPAEVLKPATEKIDDNISINREEINEDKKTISHVWVTKGDKTVLFSRVKYAWGGTFYFRDMKISISENMFKLADAGKVNF